LAGPILIHIGYHKTGSGWLRRHFFSNPQTGFGWLGKDPGKHPIRRLVAARPLEFDAAFFHSMFETLLRPIEAAGLFPVLSFERLSGHPFSGGYDGKEIANRLAEVFPEGQVLVVLREQGSVILSTYNQYVREGGVSSLESFLRPPYTPSLRAPLFDLRHFEYHHLLRYYRGLFGPEQMLALTYEQFVDDPAAFVSAIARFSGLTLSAGVLGSLPFGATSNPSPSPTAIALCRRINRIGGVRTEISPDPLVRTKVLKKLAARVQGVGFTPRRLDERRESRLRETVAEAIGDRYVESNRVTAELTGIDLASHGWML
jgi:hypothetical protein